VSDEWNFPLSWLQKIRAEMLEEDASEEVIQSVLMAYEEVSGHDCYPLSVDG
jgi:hypothetical protein